MAAVFVSLLIVYFPVSKFDFLIGWDDQWFVTNHFTEGGFSISNIRSIFTDFYYGQYAPLNQLYYTTLYRLFGYTPGVYHIVSVMIHYINCLLVYYFLKELMGDIDTRENLKNVKLAFLTTTMFAILPINVEPVSWVAASKVLIYAMFYVVALISYRKYLSSGEPSSYYLTLVMFLFSFGAKEQAVVLPVCLVLLDYLYSRDLRNKLVWLEKLPFFILATMLGLATLDSQQIDRSDFYTWFQRIPLFFYSVSEYITKCILPVNLSYLYPFPFLKSEDIPVWLWVHVISIPIIVACFFNKLKNKIILFALSFFFIHIVLTSNLFSLARYSVIADRYAYISAVGSCLFVATVLLKYSSPKYRLSPHFTALGAIYLVALIWTSQNYVHVWKNAFTLKERLKITIESRSDFKKIKDNER
ncbi:hypothetical protein [Pedobacter endophyticus]|uniref:Dolichyl-phosphate-mannose-protein mannosyltransferase n=1 Tax=Pedobacter endophyticus TaxID=2789740 RepID=A0A7U3Q6K1_9SPHI|nr:hypothetical protein [Pedobacter endophyticus]QPH38720.1 hypothetical protein IZT61_16835 [Pedobacter endophyticus]